MQLPNHYIKCIFCEHISEQNQINAHKQFISFLLSRFLCVTSVLWQHEKRGVDPLFKLKESGKNKKLHLQLKPVTTKTVKEAMKSMKNKKN